MERQRKESMHQTTEILFDEIITTQKGGAKEKSNHKTSETKSDRAIKANGMVSFIKRQRFSG